MSDIASRVDSFTSIHDLSSALHDQLHVDPASTWHAESILHMQRITEQFPRSAAATHAGSIEFFEILQKTKQHADPDSTCAAGKS